MRSNFTGLGAIAISSGAGKRFPLQPWPSLTSNPALKSHHLLNLCQIKLQPRQHQRSELAFDLGGAVELITALLEREDFERLVGRIANPVFLHAEAGVEFLLVVTVALDGGR